MVSVLIAAAPAYVKYRLLSKSSSVFLEELRKRVAK